MKILAIETSCDETAISLVEAKGGLKNPRFKILENLVASQIKIHRPFGGVVPNLAKREHLKNLPILYKRLQTTDYRLRPDLIAVTVGPGLEPCLWTGINFAKELKTKLIGVSHLEGHLYSFLLSYRDCFASLAMTKNIFPAVALIISGGHTILLLMKDLTHYKKLGETRDDAVGEAFDKVARLLNLSYPGGPEIEKLAKKGNPEAINFPRPMMNQKNYDFSFSGLKTAVLYYLKESVKMPSQFSDGTGRPSAPAADGGLDSRRQNFGFAENQAFVASETFRTKTATAFLNNKKFLADISASFQKAAFDVLISKTLRAAEEFNAKSIMISGGVASSNFLRNYLKLRIKNEELRINLIIPPKKLCTDNAAMIAVAGYINYSRKKNRRLVARGNLELK